MTPTTLAPPAAAPPVARLLMPSDYMVRRPLRPWAADLRAEVDSLAAGAVHGDFDACSEVVRCGNNAGLIFTMAGDASAAGALCRRQVEWLDRMARAAGRPELRVLALQPLVNLGRLDGRGGRLDEALRSHAGLLELSTGRPSRLGPFVVEGAHWAALGWDEEALRGFARTVYVADALRFLLAARRWDDVLALAGGDAGNGDAGDGPGLPLLFRREATLVALGALGRVDEGVERAAAWRAEAASLEKMVFQLRWAELLRMAGRRSAADRAAEQLVEVCERLRVAARPRASFLLIVQQVVRVAQDLCGAARTAVLSAELLAGIEAVGDEVMALETLRMLPGEVWRAEGERRLEETLYAQFRRGRPAEAVPELRALDRALEAAMPLDPDGPALFPHSTS